MNIITREELLRFHPCKEGLELFDKLSIDGKLELSTTVDAVKILVSGGSVFWFWILERFATPSLARANLAGAYLTGAIGING